MKELRCDGRVALVTGGGRGIARCHSFALAGRGAQVVVADYGSEIDGSVTRADRCDALSACFGREEI